MPIHVPPDTILHFKGVFPMAIGMGCAYCRYDIMKFMPLVDLETPMIIILVLLVVLLALILGLDPYI
jgi:hypothetical protein